MRSNERRRQYEVEQVRERLAAGASLVQGYTAFIYRGPGWAREINRGLLAG